MKVKHQNFDVIHPLENPYDKQGGLSVLFGNLAPKGAVIKVGGVDPSSIQERQFVLTLMMKLLKPLIIIQ